MMRTVVFVLALVSWVRAEGLVKPVSFNHLDLGLGLSDETDENLIKLLQEQINVELSASYMYQAYAALFGRADVALPGFRKFFSDASKEERDHAEALIEYVNKRGGSIEFPKIKFDQNCHALVEEAKKVFELDDLYDNNGCICYMVAKLERPNEQPAKDNKESCERNRGTWKHGLYAMSDALAIERVVYSKLFAIHKQAGKDPVLTHLLEHDFLTEQVEAIKKMADHVTRLQRFAKTNEYSVGEYLVDRSLA